MCEKHHKEYYTDLVHLVNLILRPGSTDQLGSKFGSSFFIHTSVLKTNMLSGD